jgi:ferredoxin
MKKHLFVLPLILVVFFVLFTMSLAFSVEATLTPQNPIIVDTKARIVSTLAELNGKYFVETTRHAVVFKGGKFGDKSVFAGLVDPKTFHEALVKTGFKPGNNMTMDNKEKTFVAGDLLDVSVTWKGAKKIYSLDEVIKDSSKRPIAIHFGGNLPLALEKNTGCLICLDSCPVGITSNSAYTYGAVEMRKETGFTGNKDVLPADRSLVVITFKAKK